MTLDIAHRIYQHSPLVYRLLVLRRDTLIHRTTKKEYDGVLAFKQKFKNPFFKRRVEATNDYRVCSAHRLRPGKTSVFCFGSNRARGKKGNKMAVQ